jgi:hypothetical protein
MDNNQDSNAFCWSKFALLVRFTRNIDDSEEHCQERPGRIVPRYPMRERAALPNALFCDK